jgi:hypothetical protein
MIDEPIPLSIQLVERFYDPLSGEIYLDGDKITDLNVQEYRKQIALVSQEPSLYSGTIRFNILLGAIMPESEVTQEEIEQACRNANILDFIQSLPEYVLSLEKMNSNTYPFCYPAGSIPRSAEKARNSPVVKSVRITASCDCQLLRTD